MIFKTPEEHITLSDCLLVLINIDCHFLTNTFCIKQYSHLAYGKRYNVTFDSLRII